MFTGIIESLGKIVDIKQDRANYDLSITSDISHELKVDQSVAHNGICLTVTAVSDNTHQVTAIQETMNRTNLGELKKNDLINLERCMVLNDRLDGHIVQGHVDQTATCTRKENQDGSWLFDFEYTSTEHVTVEKGSICINGVSLTCFDSKADGFSVAIIPYTFDHTTFSQLEVGHTVNLEFDIIGKYVSKLLNKG